MACVGRKAQVLARKGQVFGEGPFFQAQGFRRGVDQGGDTSPNPMRRSVRMSSSPLQCLT